jgi:hypothetical protein
VSWLSELLGHHEPQSFLDELNLVIARWTDQSRKGRQAMTIKEVGRVLLDKADRIFDGRDK